MVPGSSSRGIFLSYRRDDAGPYARLLKSELSARFPDATVFMDLDSIEPGLDFAAVIAEAVGSCAVLVALIGHQWATITDEGGRRRLEDPDDFVRFEVQAALERAVRVIPVLVDGARPLRQQQLPPELGKLARLNALELSLARYQYDADRLLDLIQHVLAAAPGTGQPDGNARDVAARKGPEAAGGDPGHAARLFSDAERAAQSITDEESKASALIYVAEAASATDPGRAAWLFSDAERAARSVTGISRGSALAGVAVALAATDPDGAEHVAQSITDEESKASALTRVAEALAATDPGHAARLLIAAERTAESLTNESWRADALENVAESLAATDPEHAERIAQSITDEDWKASALIEVVRALAATDPGHAERIAQSITIDSDRAMALTDVAKAVAPPAPPPGPYAAGTLSRKP